MSWIEDILANLRRQVRGPGYVDPLDYGQPPESLGPQGPVMPESLVYSDEMDPALSAKLRGLAMLNEGSDIDGQSYGLEKAKSLGIKLPNMDYLDDGVDRISWTAEIPAEEENAINQMPDLSDPEKFISLYSDPSGPIQFEGLTPEKIAKIRGEAAEKFGENYTGGTFAQAEARGLSAAQLPGALEAVLGEEDRKNQEKMVDLRIDNVLSRQGKGPDDIAELNALYSLKDKINTRELAESGLTLQQLGLGIEAERVGGLNQYYSNQAIGQSEARDTQLEIARMELGAELTKLSIGGMMEFANSLADNQDIEAAKVVAGLVQNYGNDAGPIIAEYLLINRPELLGSQEAGGRREAANTAVDQLTGLSSVPPVRVQ